MFYARVCKFHQYSQTNGAMKDYFPYYSKFFFFSGYIFLSVAFNKNRFNYDIFKVTEAIVGYIWYLIFFELFCITKYRELNIKYIYLHLFSCNSNYTLYNVFCCKIANCYNVIYILFPNLHYFRSANFFTAQVPLAKATFCKIE